MGKISLVSTIPLVSILVLVPCGSYSKVILLPEKASTIREGIE
jgi:hypothetical protein